jgi:Fe2+ transport system protein FeoA
MPPSEPETATLPGVCPLNKECPLTGFDNGEAFEITELLLDDRQAQRIRELGMREGSQCGMVLNNGKLIVCVHDCRIALRREVGDSIRGRRVEE